MFRRGCKRERKVQFDKELALLSSFLDEASNLIDMVVNGTCARDRYVALRRNNMKEAENTVTVNGTIGKDQWTRLDAHIRVALTSCTIDAYLALRQSDIKESMYYIPDHRRHVGQKRHAPINV